MDERIKNALDVRLQRIAEVRNEILLLKAVIPLLADDDPLTPINGNGKKQWP